MGGAVGEEEEGEADDVIYERTEITKPQTK